MVYLSQIIHIPIVMEDNIVEKLRVNEQKCCIAMIKIVCSVIFCLKFMKEIINEIVSVILSNCILYLVSPATL